MRRVTFIEVLGATFVAACGMLERVAGSPEGPVCTMELRSAVNGSILDENGALVKPERILLRINGGEARDCSLGTGQYLFGTYSCSELGEGTYEVTVINGGKSVTQSVFVEADECHVTERHTLNFVIPGKPGDPCPDIRPLVAEIDSSAIDYIDDPLSVSDAFQMPFEIADGKLRVYTKPGLNAGVEPMRLRLTLRGGECSDAIANVPIVPQPKGCYYEPASVQLVPEMLSCANAGR